MKRGCSRITANSSSVSLPGLSRIEFGHAELADVVQQAGAAQVAQLVAGGSPSVSPISSA